ncbi:LHFPL tetraspan subfamily member 6 protein-like [Gigantopelta aegis]|uniref:LHFPL tetraspan subfamily member 6 protein-like n=1 Tax=Gigantopelta aegis TaxID=1735272 RepID=UPI001B88820F|nr:LHFPL tetraspan subfamily member 6 protein-like [Gigantopelta aegis]
MSAPCCVAIFWAGLSLVATVAAGVGFYLPYWLQGNQSHTTPVYFGVFRRCNYPRLDASGRLHPVDECGRYATFQDIPSLFWQIATVCVGVGTGVALLVSLTAVMALCARDVITPTVGRVAAAMQVCAGLLIGGGLGIYPNGWNNPEVQQACGPGSGPYCLGSCSVGWSLYLTAGGGALTLMCSILACHAHNKKQALMASYQL